MDVKLLFNVCLFFTLIGCNISTPSVMKAEIFEPIVIIEPAAVISKKCPDDMVCIDQVDTPFCIDIYEFPDIKGVQPYYAQDYYMAESNCQSVGKRLCSESEWQTACLGKSKSLYSYGSEWKSGYCNDGKTGYRTVPWLKMTTKEWPEITKYLVKNKIEVSGKFPNCKSDYEVYDLIGNTAEIVSNPKRPHGFAVKGGFWFKTLGGLPATCYFANSAHYKKFESYEFSNRCCSNIK